MIFTFPFGLVFLNTLKQEENNFEFCSEKRCRDGLKDKSTINMYILIEANDDIANYIIMLDISFMTPCVLSVN